MASAIGLPAMLCDASMSRMAPLVPLSGGSTPTAPPTGPPFSVTVSWFAVSVRCVGS